MYRERRPTNGMSIQWCHQVSDMWHLAWNAMVVVAKLHAPCQPLSACAHAQSHQHTFVAAHMACSPCGSTVSVSFRTVYVADFAATTSTAATAASANHTTTPHAMLQCSVQLLICAYFTTFRFSKFRVFKFRTMSHSWSWWAAAVGLMVSLVDGLDNGVARTPPMGWRNWNFFGGAITQDIMEQQFRAMAVSALIACNLKSCSIRATSPYHTATQSNRYRSCACARVHAHECVHSCPCYGLVLVGSLHLLSEVEAVAIRDFFYHAWSRTLHL
jgi:hypothetical protein